MATDDGDKSKNTLQNKNAIVPVGGKAPGLPGTLQRAAGTPVAKPAGRALAALNRTALRANDSQGGGRIAFIVDATGSRSYAWKEAQTIQASMFEKVGAGSMMLRLIHFGGSKVTAHGWEKTAAAVTGAMQQVQCEGGITQIIESLSRVLADPAQDRARTIILVGDSFEENDDDVPVIADQLKDAGIKVFAFLDGDSETAKQAFSLLATRTGGAFAAFGDDLPLKDLCDAVAAMATGGVSALHRLQSGAAKTLLLSLKP